MVNSNDAGNFDRRLSQCGLIVGGLKEEYAVLCGLTQGIMGIKVLLENSIACL